MNTKLSIPRFQMSNKTGLRPVSTSIILMVFLALCPEPFALCQIPQGFNYQAIARDGSGNPITDPINVKIAILSVDVPETVIWEELHSGVDPDEHGLFSIVVGQGTWQEGLANFSLIDWTVAPLYIRTKINDVSLGVSQLWSVPYAMVADSLGGPLSKLKVKADAASTLDEALFEVKNKTGQTVFAVYNEGVRIYVDDGETKSPKGGFSVGGFGTEKGVSQPLFVVNSDSIRAYIYDDPLTKTPKGGFSVGGFDALKGTTNEYLMVSPDSVRIYIDKAPSDKGVKGGFAIGGYGTTKAPDEEYLRVTRDSTRVYVNETPKSASGGFAIGSISAVPGTITTFTSLTPDNYFIGHESGKSNVDGQFNSFLGYQTGIANTAGSSNSLMGYQAGFSNTEGSGNLLLGYQSGYSNTIGNYNTFLGYLAGNKNTSGVENTFIGSFAGQNNTTGGNNTFLGFNTGLSNISGESNNFIGTNSGYSNTTGNHNVFIGTESGYSNTIGNFNSFMGYHSGRSNSKGRFNVMLGYEAGLSNDSSYNTFIGYQVGRSNTIGFENVYIGYKAGFTNIAGNANTYIGRSAGENNTNGGGNVMIGVATGANSNTSGDVYIGNLAGYETQATTGGSVFIGTFAGQHATPSLGFNVFIGQEAGQYSENPHHNQFIGFGAGEQSKGCYNNFIGHRAGNYSTANINIAIGRHAGYMCGEGNIYLGDYAGENNTGGGNIAIGCQTARNSSGGGNIFIGNGAGFSESGNYKLYISNSSGNSSTALIYGEFDTELLTFNANVGIGTTTPGYKLQVGNAADGTEARANAWNLLSDIRYKTDIEALSNALDKISAINGFYFHWNTGTDKTRQFGLSAQDVEKVLPEVVSTGEDGYKSVDYGKIVPLLVEGMKAQQVQLVSQNARIESQQQQIDELKALVEQLINKGSVQTP